MNYEELLAARNNSKMNLTHLPIGDYYRMQVDGKYRGVVDINTDLHQNIVFTKALEKECEENRKLMNPHQLHFEPVGDTIEISQLEVEMGTFLSFEQLLNDSPAVIAQKGFIDDTLKALVDITNYLHSKGIFHVCYSPRTVFARKGDHSVMLLSHGSFYMALSDQQAFYGENVSFVAPEVLSHGTVDERCDVYSIGKFMEVLFEKAEMPFEYKQAIKSATCEAPEGRFNTPNEMMKAILKRRNTKQSVISFFIAVAIALICLGIYFETFPTSSPIEFVKPAPKEDIDDMAEDVFDPEMLDAEELDSLADTTAVMERVRDYQAKAEQIFRKRYEKEADRILSRIYNKDYMSVSEKKFMADNQETLKELMDLQQKMGEEASLTPERSQLIASEIIERVTNEKKKQLGSTNHRGVQLPDKK